MVLRSVKRIKAIEASTLGWAPGYFPKEFTARSPTSPGSLAEDLRMWVFDRWIGDVAVYVSGDTELHVLND